MAERRYVIFMPGSSQDRYRHYHLSRRGRVIEFVIQYEGKWRTIVRYDTAHDRPHKDIEHPDGTQTKIEFPYHRNEEVLTIGQNDIRDNWERYREQYKREMG